MGERGYWRKKRWLAVEAVRGGWRGHGDPRLETLPSLRVGVLAFGFAPESCVFLQPIEESTDEPWPM